jgi:anti-anti-sigma regulatory factor
LDTAGVQVIAAFLREAHARGLPVILAEPSEALVAAASRLGLQEIVTASTEHP